MSITITLTDQDKSTLRTAAYGAVSLMAASGAPHKSISYGCIALTSATGLVGHVLAATVLVAVETAAGARKGESSPAVVVMARKITAALDAA